MQNKVNIDPHTRDFTIESNGFIAQIHFNLPNGQFDGVAENPGERDLAMRSAIAEAREFFTERYDAYKRILQESPELATVLNKIADSESLPDFMVNINEAAQLVAGRTGKTRADVLAVVLQ